MTEVEKLVTDFFAYIANEESTIEKAKTFMTITQQETCKVVSGNPVDGNIMGMHQLIKRCEILSIKEKVSTNKVMKDCTIKLKSKENEKVIKYSCRCVKETELRKTSEEGTWGINVNSFRYLKDK